MILETLLNNKHLFYKTHTQFILVCLSFYFLNFKRHKNTIESSETAHNLISYPWNFGCRRFKGFYSHNHLPPLRTILIRCDKTKLKRYSWVYGGVKSFPLHFKNIKMVPKGFKITSKYFVVIDLDIKK